MASLTVYARDETISFVAADAGGDDFVNNGATEVLLFNGGASNITLTITAQHRCSHGFLDDQVETIVAGELHRTGPFPHSRFGDSSRVVSLEYSDVTDLTVAVQRQRIE